MKHAKLLLPILSIGAIFPGLAHAGVNLSFDLWSGASGSQTYDQDFGPDTANTYQATWTDTVANIDVRISMIDLYSSNNSVSVQGHPYELDGDNAVAGVQVDGSSVNGAILRTHYRVEFFNQGTTTAATDESYRLTLSDIDYKSGARIERVLLPSEYISSARRYNNSGNPTTLEFSGTAGSLTNPDQVSTYDDVTFIDEGSEETINSIDFTEFSGLANFTDGPNPNRETAEFAPAQGSMSIVLSELNQFEFATEQTVLKTDGGSVGSRFLLDFSDPSDNVNIIPEPSAYSLLVGFVSCVFILLRRPRR